MKTTWFWVILVVALAGRVAVVPWGHSYRAMTPDSRDYLRLANTLLDDGSFGSDPEVFRTPGYPVLIAGALLTGGDSATYLVLVFQCLLGGGTCVLVHILAERLAGARVALLAMASQAVTPVAVAGSARLLSETTYTFLLTGGLVLLLMHLRNRRWIALVLAGVALVLSAYIRPVGLVMGVLLVLFLLCLRRWKSVGTMLAIVVLGVTPWIARNAVVADYCAFSSFATESMFAYSAPQMLAAEMEPTRSRPGPDAESKPVTDLQIAEHEMIQRSIDRNRSRSDEEQSRGYLIRAKRDVVLDVIREHPLTFARLHLKGDLNFWLPGATELLEVTGQTRGQKGTLTVIRQEGFVAGVRHYFGGNTSALVLGIALSLIWLVKMLGILSAGVLKFRFRLPPVGWLMLAMVLVSFLIGGVATTPRFRVPMEPILSIAAAVGWLAPVGRFRRPREATAEQQ
ncbi:MAG: glycosyltransferase family 39 protein [Phycisphaerae bacterium]